MISCFICKKKLKNRDQNHVYRCAKEKGFDVRQDDLRYQQIKHITQREWTREWLIDLYINQEYSLTDFRSEFGLTFRQTQFLLDYFEIPRRSHAEGVLTSRRLDKSIKTCQEKYNTDNPSQSPMIKRKKADTFLLHYGVDNIWKSKSYRNSIDQLMLSRYGKKSVPNLHGRANSWGWNTVTDAEKRERINKTIQAGRKWYDSLSDEEKEEYAKKRTRPLIITWGSKLESRFEDILDSIEILHTRQFWIKRRSFDFRIQGTRILIEIQGDYWHANPQVFNKDDILKFPGGNVTAFSVWERDEHKKNIASSYGYITVYLWESNMKKMSDNALKEWIKDVINVNS